MGGVSDVRIKGNGTRCCVVLCCVIKKIRVQLLVFISVEESN